MSRISLGMKATQNDGGSTLSRKPWRDDRIYIRGINRHYPEKRPCKLRKGVSANKFECYESMNYRDYFLKKKV